MTKREGGVGRKSGRKKKQIAEREEGEKEATKKKKIES